MHLIDLAAYSLFIFLCVSECDSDQQAGRRAEATWSTCQHYAPVLPVGFCR